MIPKDAIFESWDSVYKKSLALADIINKHCLQTGEKFDLLVVVPRGGYYPANIISRELGFRAVDLLHASVGSFHGGKRGEFNAGQLPTRREVSGKNLIIIDEVSDTGRTLKYVFEYLKHIGAETVRIGVLHHKPSHNQTDFKPDWLVETTDKWIVYPWEILDEHGARSAVHR